MKATKEKKEHPTLELGFCDKCQWLHETDTDKGTNFMGVRLCPLHAAATDLLEACKNLLVKESAMENGDLYLEFRAIEAAIKKAEGE